MSPVFAVALPVFAVIVAGYAAGRARLAPFDDSAALNRFVFRFAMPAALFGLTANAAPPGGTDLVVAGVYGVAALAAMLGAYGVARIIFGLDASAAGAHALVSVFGNAVFLGLPIALSIPGWAEHFVVLMLVEGIAVIALGAALIAPGRKSFVDLVAGPFRNPLVIGMAAGLLVSLISAAVDMRLPQPVSAFFEILGRAAGPTALFSLGLFFAGPAFRVRDEGHVGRQPIAGRIAAIVVVKLVLLPTALVGGLLAFSVRDPVYLGPAALFGLVPSAVGSFVMADAHGVYRREVATAIAVSTLLSVLTLSAVLVAFAPR